MSNPPTQGRPHSAATAHQPSDAGRSPRGVPERLEAIRAEFADLEPQERLELLLDFANRLPPLPPEYQARKEAGENRVHECMTPVYLWIDVREGAIEMHAYVAEEAPTVKGFVSILVEALQGARPEEVLDIPADLLARLGLQQALGMTRMHGLSAILRRVRTHVERAALPQDAKS
jgi:cysteine desulfuration protein SufE